MESTVVLWLIICAIVLVFCALQFVAYFLPKKYREIGAYVPFENVLYALMATGLIYGIYTIGIERGRGAKLAFL